MKFDLYYRSEFHQVEWCEEEEIIKNIWFTPIELDEEVYKKEVLRSMEATKTLEPSKILVDTTDALFNILPDTQEWVNHHFQKVLEKIQVTHMAWLVSADLFAQVSYDQTMDESNEIYGYEIMYFEDYNEAIEWLSKTSTNL
ncbi:hypothetical protein KMW28_27415 [Flammeovirga yaeyamensis]|uniref:STAS/SEC14 domain-containing protein n=1 Tax=Flammeovirga yaeyamensis TaxID=367791 RepID=A0AAX1NDQ5_9BACT|nr:MULTISPECIES: hypothetical protein [Flammeovirga]ANQ52321.1 hypothetical protein MY04_4986 [Flammeovirga sp. MY04]MBB3699987.1 hypothetical protein [Flammeovirga yaeyamensis]NMF37574.1 hypothetical protein [Flammeovirga yaeyamensis]QWG04631.1 hypothetical protein KMW28_27415 [Flammeovirga yaeyamensis]